MGAVGDNAQKQLSVQARQRSVVRQPLRAQAPSWLTIEGSCVTRPADLLVL